MSWCGNTTNAPHHEPVCVDYSTRYHIYMVLARSVLALSVYIFFIISPLRSRTLLGEAWPSPSRFSCTCVSLSPPPFGDPSPKGSRAPCTGSTGGGIRTRKEGGHVTTYKRGHLAIHCLVRSYLTYIDPEYASPIPTRLHAHRKLNTEASM